MSEKIAVLESFETRFRRVFGDAHELTETVPFRTTKGLSQKTAYNLIEFEGKPGQERATFAAAAELDHNQVIVEYQMPYGLRVKRTRNLAVYKEGEKPLLGEGRVTCDLGVLQVVYGLRYDTWPFLVDEHLLENPHNLRASILLLSAQQAKEIPVASVLYTPSADIRFNAEFPLTEYDAALSGQIEQRKLSSNAHADHQKTYYQWEYLEGAKIGLAKFEDETSARIKHYRWLPKINNRRYTKIGDSTHPEIGDTPYDGKIGHPKAQNHGIPGVLKLIRRNRETGEIWTWAIPDMINPVRFRDSFNTGTFENFLWTYPVEFSIKKQGERKQTFSTYSLSKQCFNKMRTR